MHCSTKESLLKGETESTKYDQNPPEKPYRLISKAPELLEDTLLNLDTMRDLFRYVTKATTPSSAPRRW